MINYQISIGKKCISKDKLFFTIEEGQANEGDFNKAIKMIKTAKETGADAIEFQLAIASDFYIRSHPAYDIYKKREFSFEQIKNLVVFTKENNLEFIATPLSPRLIEILINADCSAFNINASDINNPSIIVPICESNIPFFISLPLATEEEIKQSVDYIKSKNGKNFILMLGQHTMASGEHGVDIKDTNLGYLNTLEKKYNVPVGFIDHTSIQWIPSVAVAAGANVISKHITISRKDKGPDWHICLEPEEMKNAINWARDIKESMNNKEKTFAKGENIDKTLMRRSIVAAKKLETGKQIELDDIVFKRPGTGLEPFKYEEIIGRVTNREIKYDEQIKLTDLKE